MKAPHLDAANPHRGYTLIGREDTSALKNVGKGGELKAKVANVKVGATMSNFAVCTASLHAKLEQEAFDMGHMNDKLCPNIWVPEDDLPRFRGFMENFFILCSEVQMKILHALAIGLGLHEESFDKPHGRGDNELRLTHYPEIAVDQLRSGAKTRISEHSDFGTLTLLFQDSVGGLEAEDPSHMGHFAPVESSLGEIIINIGDMLQRGTCGKLKSTCHRVHIPQRDIGENGMVRARYSVAYFAKFNRDFSMSPFPEFLNNGYEVPSEQMTAWEFNQARLLRTY